MARHRRSGIILIGVGVGLMLMIGLINTARHGFGVGGFLVAIGLAFFISSLFETPRSLPPSVPPPPPGVAGGSPGGDQELRP